MPQPYKIQKVEEIKKLLEGAKSIVVTEYRGLSVEEMSDLRTKLREEDAVYKVIKNNFFKVAIKEEGYYEDVQDYFKGPVAVTISYSDPIAPLKKLTEFAKSNDKLKLKAVVLEGKVYGEEMVEQLSKLPSKEQLYGMLVNVLQAPLTGLVRALNWPMQSFVGVLKQISEKKEA
jgi:large subunit ribosomal protein L10